MAKKYQFVLHAIRAKFDHSSGSGYVGVIIDMRDFYRENALALIAFEGSLVEAVAEREKQAKLLNQPASWSLEMADRKEKKPAGFKAIRELHYEPSEAQS